MKLNAVSLVYNEAPLVKGCVECLKPFVERHVICVGTRPYYGKAEPLDKSAEIAENLGAEVVLGEWDLDHHQRNTGLALAGDCDWIITTDVDMWITKRDMVRLVEVLSNTTEDAVIIAQNSYWKDTDHILKDDDFKPVIAVRPHVRFIHIGNIAGSISVVDDIRIHHLAWCEPKDIRKKVLTYPHAPELNGELWYKANYECWQEGQDAVFPDRRFKVVKQPLPDELKCYLK